MSKHSNSFDDREQRLDEVLAQYVQSERAGLAPDREALLNRYPEFASELAEFFGDEDGIDQLIGRVSDSSASPRAGDVGAQDMVKPPSLHGTSVYAPDLPEGALDRYEVKQFYARGGMGEVWLTRDMQIGRQVALKKLRKGRQQQRDRFLVEAQITGQLEHPGVVPLYDLGTDKSDQPYYIMKLVQGRTLKEAIGDYHAPAETHDESAEVRWLRLLEVFVDVCQTVAYAHSRGVVHRDVKPDNVMLGPYGETVLLDWGLAKVQDDPEQPSGPSYVEVSTSGSSATRAGSVMGSPPYMAPEAASGQPGDVDKVSDVYLLGATLYEILAGKPPRRGSSYSEMVELARTSDPPPPRTIQPRIPRALDAICLKAMSRRKPNRYVDPLALANDIQRYLAGEPVSAYREGVAARAWRWCKRHRRVLGYSAAAGLIFGLTLFSFAKLREADSLRQREVSRTEVEDFLRLADEVWFFATSSDPPQEHAPYYDQRKGVTSGQAVLELAEKWGPDLSRLLVAEEYPTVPGELFDLHLLQVQALLKTDPSPDEIQNLITLLDSAANLRAPTRSYYRLRAQCSKLLGNDAMALRESEQASKQQTPTTALDHFLLGEEHRTTATGQRDSDDDPWTWSVDHQDLERAVEEYQAALRKEPDHFWSHLQLGRCLLSLGREAEAVQALGACVALRPESPWGYSARGLAFALSDRFNEALSDLNNVVGQHPHFMPSRLNRGVTYWLNGDDTEAVEDFTTVLSAPEGRRLIEAAYYRGQIQWKRGKYNAALDDFRRVELQRRGFRHLYRARADVHFLRGDIDEGLGDLNTYLELASGGSFDADAWEACFHRGRFLLRYLVPKMQAAGSERTVEIVQLAEKEFRSAVDRDGQLPALFYDWGTAMQTLGQLPQAVDAFSRGIDMSRDDVKLRIARGWAYYFQGRNGYDQALADFREAARLDAGNAEAHTGLGYVRAVGRRTDQAEHSATLALLHGAGDYLALHNIACIYAELSRYDGDGEKQYQDRAMDMLRRTVELWQQGDFRSHNELDQIKREPAFQPLRHRDDFQKLIQRDDR